MRHGLLCLLLWSTGVAADTSSPPIGPLPLEYFTRHDEIGDVKIAPDGAHIALMVGRYGRSALAFHRRSDKKPVGGVRAPDGFEIAEFHWVSPTRVIYMIAQRQPGLVEPTRTGEISAIDIDGSNHRQIYGYRATGNASSDRNVARDYSYATARLVTVLPRDPRHILITEHPWRRYGNHWRTDPDAKPRITRLDAYDGSRKELGIAPLASARVHVDSLDRVRFASGFDANGDPAVAWRSEPDGPWHELVLPGFRKETIWPQHVAPDSKSAYFSAVRESEEFDALFRLEFATGGVEAVAQVPGGNVRRVVTDLKDEQVIGVTTYADKPRRILFGPADDSGVRFYRALERAFPGHALVDASWTDDFGQVIAFMYSDVNPGDYYLVDAQGMKADLVRSSRDWIDPRLMRPREPIQLRSRDGLALTGYLTRPAGQGPHPMVVLPQSGGKGDRDYWGFDWEAQLLANRGYAVLQLNNRGSGGFGRAFEEAGNGEWGGRRQDDLTDATRWAVEERITTSDRICILGTGFGGYAALMGAAREPGLYRCAIGLSGIYDLELLRTSADSFKSRVGAAYLDRMFGTDPNLLRAHSPVTLAASIRAPVMLIHGTEDLRADYEQARRMKAALEQEGKLIEWVALKREGYGIYDEETRKEVYERVLAFLDSHLKAAADPHR